jgi:hypothetical protein
MKSNELLQVSEEFLKQNSKHAKIKKHAKKGGPYSKIDKDKRRDEVYRLHFEYGYSARKISTLMKVNRNTINGDIDYWYNRVLKKINYFVPEIDVKLNLEQMRIQVTRLRELLDKTKTISEKTSIERIIYEINSKIIYINQKFIDSQHRTNRLATEMFNETMKKNHNPQRRISVLDTIGITEKGRQKIRKIVSEERRRI